LAGADHTFSKPGQLEWLSKATSAWMHSLALEAGKTKPAAP
jgi:hypothetical protein